MIHNKKILFSLLVSSFVFVSPTAISAVSVKHVVQSVMHDSLDVAISQKRVQSSEASITVEQGRFDWALVGKTGYEHQEIPTTTAAGVVTTGTTSNDVWSAGIGLKKQFQNGVSITPGLQYFYQDNDSLDTLTDTQSIVHLGVNIPMMKGSGEEVVTASVKSSKLNFESAKLQHMHDVSQSVAESVKLFWSSLAAKKSLEALQQTARYATEFSNSLKQLADQGEIAPITYQNTQAALLLKRQDINKAATTLGDAKRRLLLMMNSELPPTNNGFELTGDFPAISENLDEMNLDSSRWIEMALQNRTDMKALRLRLDAELMLAKSAKNALLPQVDLNFDLDRVYLTYEKTFGNKAARGRVTQSKTSIDRHKLEITKLKRTIENNVLAALDRIRNAHENYQYAVPSVELYEMMNTNTRQKIKQGEATPNEYTVIQDKLAQAKRHLILAQRDYANGIAMLRLATGTVGINEGHESQQVATQFMSL